MPEQKTLSILQRLLGLAMIAAGICGVAVEFAKGETLSRLGQASPSSAQAAESPRIENAKLETRTVGASLDATMRELAKTTEKPEWVGYRVDQIAGERGVCCDNN